VPHQTHFGELTGLADDVVNAGQGFGMHPHQDMEITTVMLRGSQVHADSTGRSHTVDATTVQTMSAGTGIRHSENNGSATESFHSFQIWVHPKELGVQPRYEAFHYAPADKRDRFLLALSPDRRAGSALINQDAFFSVSSLTAGKKVSYAMNLPANGVYVHCASGRVDVAGVALGPGDALGVYEVDAVEVTAQAASELVLVEVPMVRGVRL
jgi:redox-sensitive bicupin YhaK (pirin superfamily)